MITPARVASLAKAHSLARPISRLIESAMSIAAGTFGVHEADRGGHFAMWEHPELFAAELRAAFTSFR